MAIAWLLKDSANVPTVLVGVLVVREQLLDNIERFEEISFKRTECKGDKRDIGIGIMRLDPCCIIFWALRFSSLVLGIHWES